MASLTAEKVTEGMDLTGKTYLVTGCATGLGLESIRVLSLRGATVIGTARSKERAEEGIAKVTHGKGKLIAMACDLSKPESIKACVAEVKRSNTQLDAVLASAGIMAVPKFEPIHGIESQFFTNVVGHYMLISGLLDNLTETGRIVITSSNAIRFAPSTDAFGDVDNKKGTYTPWKAYGTSKLGDLLLAKQFAERLKGTKKTANSLHPGVIMTDLQRHLPPFIRTIFPYVAPLIFPMKSIPQGTATQIFLATSPDVAGVSGKYFSDCSDAAAKMKGLSKTDDGKEVWELVEKIVAGL